VRSIFTVTEAEFDKPAPLTALQVSVVPAAGVSVLRVVVVQPLDEAIPDSGSETDQVTVTDPLFQPLPLALGVTVDVITGGVVSARKLAVIVPVPCIVAFVDADEELTKVIDVALLLQDEKAYPLLAFACMLTTAPSSYPAVAEGWPLTVIPPPPDGLTTNDTCH
jgi:hypothetical protein